MEHGNDINFCSQFLIQHSNCPQRANSLYRTGTMVIVTDTVIISLQLLDGRIAWNLETLDVTVCEVRIVSILYEKFIVNLEGIRVALSGPGFWT